MFEPRFEGQAGGSGHRELRTVCAEAWRQERAPHAPAGSKAPPAGHNRPQDTWCRDRKSLRPGAEGVDRDQVKRTWLSLSGRQISSFFLQLH